MTITTFIILLVILVNIAVASTEVGKYKFLSLFFVPLYNRLNRNKVYDNFTRGKIHGYIKANPGENYNAIKEALTLKNGSLAYHIRVLEKEGYVYSNREGVKTRFYPIGTKINENGSPTLKQKLFEIISNHPGKTQHEIVSILDSSQQIVSYNLTKLVRENRIRYEQHGREKRYYIIVDQSKSL
jgi:predicted transcriptional regulator